MNYNFISQLLDNGISEDQIIASLSKTVPHLAKKAKKMISGGWSSKDILNVFSKDKEAQKSARKGLKPTTPSEMAAMNLQNSYSNIPKGTSEQSKETLTQFTKDVAPYALGYAGSKIAAPMAEYALSRALPNASPLLKQAAKSIGNPLQMPTQQTQPSPVGNSNQYDTAQQPPVNQTGSNIPQPANIQQAEVISNPKEYLEKAGVIDVVDDHLKRGTSPEGIATLLSTNMNKKGRLGGKVDPELLKNIEEYAKTAQEQPQVSAPVEPSSEKLDEAKEVERPKIEKNIPEHLKSLFSQASKIKSSQDLKERMYVGTQEAYGDRDIQRIGRLISSKDQPNVKEFAEQNPHEWEDSFKQYGVEKPKLGQGKIAIYRAAPKGSEIESGDFVAVTKNYADQHIGEMGRDSLLRKIVNVEDVINDAGDPNEWIYAPKKDVEFMSSLSHEDILNLSKQKPNESTKIEKNSVVSSPQGVGEVKSIKDKSALIDINGKLTKVDVKDLESEPPDIAELYDNLFNAIPDEYKSRMMNYAGYDEDANELIFRPHGGAAYVYKDIPPEFAEDLKNRLHRAKTTGKNMYGMWNEGDQSFGAGMSALIRELQKVYGGKGKEYVRKYNTLFDILGIPHEEKKRKEQEERRKRKANG